MAKPQAQFPRVVRAAPEPLGWYVPHRTLTTERSPTPWVVARLVYMGWYSIPSMMNVIPSCVT